MGLQFLLQRDEIHLDSTCTCNVMVQPVCRNQMMNKRHNMKKIENNLVSIGLVK